ncbi:GNAT family N-acetyltransferase [Nocardia sp. CDC160]|uniref:GNAT family N-acetyltransferase n=1 Tax=Nocardia sp. CDC160 TaxID=3112166 RepID=UPI002DB9B79C|nr:GNAT family N-acetyltransferase [Nocardia sp. CDC160]MEC3920007.1 GNAT family N-acetyltransferase [Nocardia sp. CDC160]
MIRECGEQDLEFLEHCLPTGENRAHEAHFRRQQQGLGTLLVAWIDEMPCGTCVINWTGPIHPAARVAFPDCPELCFLQIAAVSRNQGIGTALIAAVEERVLARGLTHVGLAVEVTNADALRLYKRLGYIDTGLVATTEYSVWDEFGVKKDLVETDCYLLKELG